MDEVTYDIEDDMSNSPEFVALMADDEFCKELWSAFANVTWYKKYVREWSDEDQVMDILKEDYQHRADGYSFRGAGGLIARIRNAHHGKDEDYMDYYCCGPYSTVTERVREAFLKLGWVPNEDDL